MITRRTLYAVVSTATVTVALALPGRGAALEPPGQVSSDAARVTGRDNVLRHEIKRVLAGDPVLEGAHIAVSARDGLVTLAGVVASESQRQRAVALTGGTHGVRLVDNALEVQPAVSPAGAAR